VQRDFSGVCRIDFVRSVLCCPAALLNSLLAAVRQYHRSQTLAIVKEIAEEQRKGFRWYNP
jgi:hypothetical protein